MQPDPMTDAELEELKAYVAKGLAQKADSLMIETSAILALIARLEAAEGGWRPIESAPKDGRPVLLTARGGQIGVCFWSDDRWIYHGLTPVIDADWWDAPTHWRPLPAPPALPNAEA